MHNVWTDNVVKHNVLSARNLGDSRKLFASILHGGKEGDYGHPNW